MKIMSVSPYNNPQIFKSKDNNKKEFLHDTCSAMCAVGVLLNLNYLTKFKGESKKAVCGKILILSAFVLDGIYGIFSRLKDGKV